MHVYACAETLFCNITMTTYRKMNQDESTLVPSLVVGRSDGRPRGPMNGLATDNNVRECPNTTTACMHVSQTYVWRCCVMFEYPMHNFDVAPALETVKSPNGARFMMHSVLVSPVPTPNSARWEGFM